MIGQTLGVPTRRGFLCSALLPGALAGRPPAIGEIERSVIWHGRQSGVTWFHPRVCAIPGRPHPTLLMTVQTISGSDYYGPVHWSESRDLGRTWSEPRPIPGMGRALHADGVEEGICDAVPEYHARTGSVLAMAQNVYYKDGKLTRATERRWPVYIVRDAVGHWSELKKLAWDNPEASAMHTSGCSQRVTLAGGDVLVSLSYAPLGRADRAVCTVRCAFDGRELRILRAGNAHRLAVKRGLLEPTLASYRGRYYMTIRAEDDRGYATVSSDGLQWAPLVAWRWDNGEPLALSSTQQRWLVHRNGLFLVYTRRDPSNRNVVRWRAPLYAARVNVENLSLVRSTECVVFPMSGDGVNAPDTVAHLGNFHTNPVTKNMSFVTVGEVLPKQGFRGDTFLARIHWSR